MSHESSRDKRPSSRGERARGGDVIVAESQAPALPDHVAAPASAAWQPLQKSLVETCGGLAAFQQRVQILFSELERFRDDLDRRGREVAHRQHEVAKREQAQSEQRKEVGRLSHLVEQQEAQLQAAWNEIESLKAELATSRLRYTEEVDRLHQERCELKQRASAGGDESERLTDALRQLNELRRELAATRSNLAEQTAELERARAAGRDSDSLAVLEEERAELEAELQVVRGRAEELYEKVREQKSELHHQRESMMTELRQLRRVVERQAELLAQRAGEPREAAPHEDAHPRDPVLDSVTSQFARLHKNTTERRGRNRREQS